MTKKATRACPDAPSTAVGTSAPMIACAESSKLATFTLKRASSTSLKWSRNADQPLRKSVALILPVLPEEEALAGFGVQPCDMIHLTSDLVSRGSDGNVSAANSCGKNCAVFSRSRFLVT